MEIVDWDILDDILVLRRNDDVIFPDAEDIYSHIFKGKKEICGIIPNNDPTLLLGGLTFSIYPLEPIIEISLQNGQNIYFQVKINNDEFPFQIKDLFTRKIDHVIVEKTWYPFVKGALTELKNFLYSIGVTQPGIITLKQYLLIIHNQDFTISDLTTEQINAHEFSKTLLIPSRNSIFKGSLYPYQKEGYSWLSYMDKQDIGCILADDMGLGKTIQVIGLLADRVGSGKPCLVIAPATLLENWRREIAKFTEGMEVYIHQGPKRSGFSSELKRYDVVVTSYETVVRDRYMLKRIDWDIVILDEAQAIKNPEAKRSKAVKLIPHRSAIAMSGTPVQNNLIDLWSISDFAIPGLLGSMKNFEHEYTMDTDSAKRVEPLVSPIMLRRRIDEVARDLPEKIDIPQPIIMDIHSMKEYEDIRNATIDEYGEYASLVVLQKLRMYCAHPILINNKKVNPIENSNKYNRLLEILEEIFNNNQKAIVFTSWVKMIDILVEDIPERFGVYANKIDGRVKIHERQLIVDKFNSMVESGILVVNPVAGGVGLNITGANHVIHYNLEWNPAVVDQATARAYRKGQKRPVTVHRLFYVDTVEEIINERLEFKREVADAAVVGVKGKDEDYQFILKALQKTPIGR